MTAITEAPESLDWVTFSDDDDGPCEATAAACPNEAVARAWFDAPCECCPNPQRLCAHHRDRTAAKARLMDGLFTCRWCAGFVMLLRIEPIR